MTLTADEQFELHVARELFPSFTIEEALALAEEQDDWLVPGLISATSTLVFGEAKIGKSWLVSHLIGALLSGGEFLQEDVPDRPYSVGVFFTDDAGHIEYSKRIASVVQDIEHRVALYPTGIMQPDHWDSMLAVVQDAGHNVVVIDNLSQILDGSINDDAVVRRCFDGIRKLIRAGITVVIVAHSSDKSFNGQKPDTPLGSSYISTAVRWLVRVKKTRNRNLKLTTYGNVGQGHQGLEMVLRTEVGARFTVLETTTTAEIVKETRIRSTETLDQNAVMADWVVANCQGLSQTKAAAKLAEEFGGSQHSYKTWLGAGNKLGVLLHREGTAWKRS